MKWWYYLHTNGDLIGKNPVVVDGEYFDGPFVTRSWCIETSDRSDAWRVVLEALALGMSTKRAVELTAKWKLTYEDSVEMLARQKRSELMKKGMTRFISECLNMEVEKYWRGIRALGEKVA